MVKKKLSTTPFWRFLFLLYCAVMLWLLFCRSNSWNSELPYEEQLRQNTNLIPFLTIQNYLYVLSRPSSSYMLRHCFINLAGNIILFIPVGWLLPRLWQQQRNFFRFFTTCLGTIFLVEVLQLFTLLGRFDVDDIILNLLGMTLGFILQAIFIKR